MNRKIIIVCVLCICLLSVAARANLLENGNFNTGDLSGWDVWVGDANNSISILPTGGPDSSPCVEMVAIVNTTPDDLNISQSVDCSAGTEVGISFDFAMTANAGEVGWAGGGVGVTFWNSDWSSDVGYGWADVWDTGGAWTSFENTWITSGSWVAPTGTAHVTFRIGPWAGDGGTVTYDVDNVVFTPEPATIALLALGGLTVLRKRK